MDQNLPSLFYRRAVREQAKPAFRFKSFGKYRDVSWGDFLTKVYLLCKALETLGLLKGFRAGILSENRPEWNYADLAVLSLGGATVPLYPTSSPKDISYVLNHAQVSILFVSTREQL